eukprot:scaffold613465_cov20-Prasinocladus_malaysianus.AAC.2
MLDKAATVCNRSSHGHQYEVRANIKLSQRRRPPYLGRLMSIGSALSALSRINSWLPYMIDQCVLSAEHFG